MNYFFPGILNTTSIHHAISPELKFPVNSGRNGLRLLLRACNLPRNSKVAIPAFVCELVKEAVLLEDFIPVEFDLKSDGSYWTDYNEQLLNSENVQAIILVHLYGSMHPDTSNLISFANKNHLPLIHDAAQSYGLNESILGSHPLIMYSFGPGKSSTAALGAFVKNVDDKFYEKNISKHSFFETLLTNLKSKNFIQSRFFKTSNSIFKRIFNTLLYHSFFKINDHRMLGMTSFQMIAGSKVMAEVSESFAPRKIRADLFQSALEGHPVLSIPIRDEKRHCFKTIVFCSGNQSKFETYLQAHSISHFRLFPEKTSEKIFPYFHKNKDRFFEFSTEVSVPLDEIQRIADCLKKFE